MQTTPHSISSTVAGVAYKASAWVKSNKAGVRAEIRITERTWDGKSVTGGRVTSGEVLLTENVWTYISIPGHYTVKAAGNVLDVTIAAPRLPGSTTLDVDDISLRTEAEPTKHWVHNVGGASDTWGWQVSSDKSTLSLNAGGRTGQCARLTVTGTPTATPGIVDNPKTVQATTATVAYTVKAFVRTSQRQNVTIRLWERTRTGSAVGEAKTFTKPVDPGAWTDISVTHTASGTGNTMDVGIYASGAPTGLTLDIDDITLTADPYTGWRQAWADEFDGSTVDATKWEVLDGQHYGSGIQVVGDGTVHCLWKRNVTVANSVLTITARKETTTCATKTFPYTSGHLLTEKQFTFTYGRVEMRARTPLLHGSSKGLWPALWMRPWDPKNLPGEVDVFEQIGTGAGESDVTRVVKQTVHNYPATDKKSFEQELPDGSSTYGAFHVYGIEWDANAIKWYIDSPTNVVNSVTSADIPSWYGDFRTRFFLRLNMSIGGGGWAGTPTSDTAFPAKYEIDWVRVWQRT